MKSIIDGAQSVLVFDEVLGCAVVYRFRLMKVSTIVSILHYYYSNINFIIGLLLVRYYNQIYNSILIVINIFTK